MHSLVSKTPALTKVGKIQSFGHGLPADWAGTDVPTGRHPARGPEVRSEEEEEGSRADWVRSRKKLRESPVLGCKCPTDLLCRL